MLGLSASRAEYDDDTAIRFRTRELVEELHEVAFEDAAEHRIAGKDARRRPSLDLVPWSEKAASVDQLGSDASSLELFDEPCGEAIPGEAAGPSIARIRPSSSANASARACTRPRLRRP